MNYAEHVEIEILRPMQALFLPPRPLDDDAKRDALRNYIAPLAPFAAIDLHTAWSEVVQVHMTRSWPLPAAIIVAARKAQKERGVDEGKRLTGRYSDDSAARWARWKEARATQAARDAVEAEVSWSFRCAILNDGKFAGDISLAELIRHKRSAEETAEAIGSRTAIMHNGRWVEFSEANRELALKLWDGQRVNESETVEEIRRFTIAPPRYPDARAMQEKLAERMKVE